MPLNLRMIDRLFGRLQRLDAVVNALLALVQRLADVQADAASTQFRVAQLSQVCTSRQTRQCMDMPNTFRSWFDG